MMKKKLYFYLWISPDFLENPAVKIHQYCLKKYVDVFDELNFVAAIDDKFDDKTIETAHKWISSIVGQREYNLDVIDNTTPRECNMLFTKILPKIVNNDKDLCFVAHSKGITDVNMTSRNKWSALRWVIAMYFYNFSYPNEITEFYNENQYSMYGSLLTHFNKGLNSKLPSLHGNFYIGNFYWLKPWCFNENALFDTIFPRTETHRYLAENIPLYVNENSLTGPNDGIITENTIADLYYLEKDKWPAYLENYGDSEKCFDFQNEVLMNTIGELGK